MKKLLAIIILLLMIVTVGCSRTTPVEPLPDTGSLQEEGAGDARFIVLGEIEGASTVLEEGHPEVVGVQAFMMLNSEVISVQIN